MLATCGGDRLDFFDCTSCMPFDGGSGVLAVGLACGLGGHRHFARCLFDAEAWHLDITNLGQRFIDCWVYMDDTAVLGGALVGATAWLADDSSNELNLGCRERA